jgi:hypothetical protein
MEKSMDENTTATTVSTQSLGGFAAAEEQWKSYIELQEEVLQRREAAYIQDFLRSKNANT